jgi:phosphoribosylglycinamide formyltransferase-1
MSERGALSLAILISGRGSNMAAIAQACAQQRIGARIAVVIADRSSAGGLALARELGLPTELIAARQFADRAGFEEALAEAIDRSGAELIVLAGFMRILSASLVQRYRGRVLNIHPSLLPKYKGLHTHRRVLEANEREHGVSVHFVTDELDAGPLIYQASLPVLASDTEQTLEERIHTLEHAIYPLAIGLIAAGRLRWQDGHLLLDGQELKGPLAQEAQHERAQAHTQAHT